MAGFHIILDRDGILNVDVGYTHRIEDFRFPKDTVEALQQLRDAGAKFVIATGQSGIARGKYSVPELEAFNTHLISELEKADISIEATAFCPHHPDHSGDCVCRKPKTGMLDQLEEKVGGIDWSHAWGIGDKPADAQMILQKDGAYSILVASGSHNNTTGQSYWSEDDEEVQELQKNPRSFIAPSLREAADIIAAERQASGHA